MSCIIEINQIIRALRISDTLTIAEILYHVYPNYYSNLHSARVQVQKVLNAEVFSKRLVKENGYYRVPECKSEYKEHSRLLTRALADVLIANPTAIIHREITIPEVALRPDAVILLIKGYQGLCFILEAVNNEPPEYLNQKIGVWRSWENSLNFLSDLFKYLIPHFDIVIAGEHSASGVYNLSHYLREVMR